jgi:hypothetical protein
MMRGLFIIFSILMLFTDEAMALSADSQKIVNHYKKICEISSRVVGEKSSPMLKRPMTVEYDFRSSDRGRNILWQPDLPNVVGIEVKDGKLVSSKEQPKAMQDMVRGIAELIAAVSTANMTELQKTMDIVETGKSWELSPKAGQSNMGRLKKLVVSFEADASIHSMKIEVGDDTTLLKFTKLQLSECSHSPEGSKP